MELGVRNLSKKELVSRCLFLESQTGNLQTSNKKQLIIIENLQATIDWFQRQYFGVKSEKIISQDPRQMTFLDALETPPSKATTVKQYERTARSKETSTGEDNNLRFDKSVPVEEKVILPKEVEDLSENDYEIIGEKITQRLKQTPCQYHVEKTIRKTVKIKATGLILRAPAPDAVIERSYADVSLLTGLIVDKFQYHLPLYRQHQRMKFSGINVSRANLTKLTHRTLELLEPVYYAILSEIQTSQTVAMDETPIKAGRRIKGKMQTAYFWPILAKEQVCFIYSNSRSHNVINSVLTKGCKKLISDGYSAYTKYAKSRDDFIHANCWAHVRRKFFNAKEYAPPESEKVLDIIRKLFMIEKSIKHKDDIDILVKRRLESQPLVEEFFSYIDRLWFESVVIKNSPLGKAIFYAREREVELKQFLEHHDIPLSNNAIEREIRPVAVGRKNWLFCWSEVGAKYAAIAFTIIGCCKMQNINSWNYIMDVLQRIDSHPMRDVHLLTPKNWKIHFSKNASQ